MSARRRFVPTREWEDERQRRGLVGEREALAYLTACGWSVEAHRFRLGRHDVDLIVRRGRTVAFVEVKTRNGRSHGAPGESVGRRKQEAIGRVAALWRLRHGRPDDEFRFDLVAVRTWGGRVEVEHVPDAWRL